MIEQIRSLAGFLFFSLLMLCMSLQAQELDPLESDLSNIRGLVKPLTSATLSSEIPARILKLPFKHGDRFKKGQVLVQFDCALYKAELAAANATLNAEEKKYENNQQLLELNAISRIETDISETGVKKAEAEKQIADVRVRRCIVRAPYDGRVVDTFVNEHESVGPDQDLLSILSDKILEIELIIPSMWLNWLKSKVTFVFHVDETRQRYQARVSQLGASVDPVSQTIRVKGVFESKADNVLSGMSGTAIFKQPEK